jgi:hypothetical protein
MSVRFGLWLVVEAIVVLATRTLVYALSPSPFARQFEHAAGGPRLPILVLVVAALALGVSSAGVWLASVAVRERRLLLDAPVVCEHRIELPRLFVRAGALFVVGCVLFALLESYIHWRAGLGWHGIECLVGPVHRNAIPILGGLSLVAAAAAAAVAHVLAWMRRTILRLGARPPVPLYRSPVLRAPPTNDRVLGPPAVARLDARGPPSLVC